MVKITVALVSTLKYAILTLLLAFVLVPLLYVLVTSFTPLEDIGKSLWPERFSLRNYQVVLFESNFLRYLYNTVFITVIVTLGSMLLDSMAAYGFARIAFPCREALFLLVVAMLIMPGEVLLVPRYILIRELGWIDDYKALIIPSLSGAFAIFFLRQFLLSLPKELEESATMDGCSRFRIFWQIVLPLIRAPLFTIGLMTFFGTWDEFLWPLTVINSPEKHVLQVAVSQLDSEFFNDIGAKFSNVVLSSLPVLILFLVVQKQYVRGITSGAVKG